ncbi:MAG: hypothetical protein ACQEQF_00680 [Bacillota bacterium]
MAITEPKRLFDSELTLTKEVIANTGSEKWIISDLWISNKTDVVREVTVLVAYQGAVVEEKRTLLPKIKLEPNQTMVLGNVIVEPNETIYASSQGEVHAFYDLTSPNENGNLKFIAKENEESGNDITLEVINPQVVDQELSCTVDANAKTINISLATDATTTPVKADFTTDFFDPDNDVVFTSKEFGADGNNIQIEIINAGNDQALGIVEEGWKITITPATDSGGNITTTASDLVTEINNNSTLIDCELKEGDEGTGFIRELSLTDLTGGVDATVTTTGNDIINLLKTNENLDSLVYIERLGNDDGTGVVDHITVDGEHNHQVNFIGGDYDKYNPNHVGITGVTIVGYGRVV